MKDVALGDMIWTGGGYERVLLWTHADAGAYTRFLRIGTRNASLALSPGHLLYVNGVLQAAGHVRAGDRVMWMQGQMGGFVETEVVSVKSVWEKGLYNPHTASGELVVDGVRTSCYTLALHSQTAHALLAPLRVLAHAMTFERTGRMVGAAIGRQVEMLGQGGYGCSV